MMKRRFLYKKIDLVGIFVIRKIFFLLVLMLCSQTFAAKKETVTVVLDWFINPNHAPLFVAKDEGFFAKRGLDVKFITPADALEGEKMVAVGKADIAITYQPALILHVSRGIPLVRFATLVDSPFSCIVALENKINSIKDLKGKKIGYSASGIDDIVFSTMLKKVGLNIKDVQMINVGFNLTQALLSGKISAFVGGMRNFEPVALEIEGKSAKTFYPEKYGFPIYDELILVTNKNKINNDLLARFNMALKEGVFYIKKNPKKSWLKFAKANPGLNDELNKKTWFISVPYFADNPAKLNKTHYRALADFMFKNKFIKKYLQVKEYAIDLLSDIMALTLIFHKLS